MYEYASHMHLYQVSYWEFSSFLFSSFFLHRPSSSKTAGGRRWPRPAAAVIVQVQDSPETPTFDSSHYHFTISEFALKGETRGSAVHSAQDTTSATLYIFLLWKLMHITVKIKLCSPSLSYSVTQIYHRPWRGCRHQYKNLNGETDSSQLIGMYRSSKLVIVLCQGATWAAWGRATMTATLTTTS